MRLNIFLLDNGTYSLVIHFFTKMNIIRYHQNILTILKTFPANNYTTACIFMQQRHDGGFCATCATKYAFEAYNDWIYCVLSINETRHITLWRSYSYNLTTNNIELVDSISIAYTGSKFSATVEVIRKTSNLTTANYFMQDVLGNLYLFNPSYSIPFQTTVGISKNPFLGIITLNYVTYMFHTDRLT